MKIKHFFFLLFLLLIFMVPTTILAQGTECLTDHNCEEGEYCNSISQECFPKAAGGLPCVYNNECQSNNCDAENGKCIATITEDPSTISCIPDCILNQYCDLEANPPVCTDKKADNDACTSSTQCSSNNCEIPSGDTIGICTEYIAPANTGDPNTNTGDPNTNTGAPTTQSLPNPLGETNINIILGRIVKYIIGISGSVALVVFIIGGAMWMISAGRPDYVKKGRAAMISAIIGLAIIFSSYIIIRFIIDAAQSIG